MSRNPRAVIFDLDDTLYPYRRFVRSGFAAVAAYLEHAHGVNGEWAFRRLLRASRGEDRGRELQACLATLRMSPGLVPVLLRILREHTPTMNLPHVSLRTLDVLHRDGWRLGILTNGRPFIQARKIAALGVGGLVDAVVFATEHGTGNGKPDPQAFLEVTERLQVAPGRAVMVGNDQRCDVQGALDSGMPAMLCTTWVAPTSEPQAGVPIVDRLTSVPSMAHVLLEEPSGRHAA
jgi:putative hydrolase of the HAD superfamily